MARIQTRRSVSISAETYERLKAYCEVNSKSMSSVVTDLITSRIPTTTRDEFLRGIPESAPDIQTTTKDIPRDIKEPIPSSERLTRIGAAVENRMKPIEAKTEGKPAVSLEVSTGERVDPERIFTF